MNRSDTRALVLLLAAFALTWFCNLDQRKLAKSDEGRYAEIPREMVASRDWLTPRLNGYKYFEKPPLQYWATALAYKAFGENEWTARLWTGLTGFLCVLLVFYAGNRIAAPPAGLYAAAVLGSSALHVLMGHFLTLDMALSFFLALTVLAFLLAQLDGVAAAQSRRWMLAGWAAMALAVLSKGLVGAVLPMAGVALYVLVQRDWGMLRRLSIVPGGALFLAIAAPWFVAVSLANEEFFRFFFLHEHFERFLTRVHGRYAPFWYFVPVLLAGAMPWVISLFPALVRAWAASPQRRFRPERFLLLWCAVVFVFFSASNSKLQGYILPLLPAAALLIGAELLRTPRALLTVQAFAAATAGAAIFALAPGVVQRAGENLPQLMSQAFAHWLGVAGAVLCAGALAAAVLAWTRRRTASIVVLAFSGLAFVQIALRGYEALSPVYSAHQIIERIRPQLKPGASFYFVDTFDHTLLFYLGRTVTMVRYRDELATAIDWEPHKFLPDVDAFARAWRNDREAYAIFSAAQYSDLLQKLDLPMLVIASDPRRIIVRKP